MRSAGSERQLTETLGAFLLDGVFAAGFLDLALNVAGRGTTTARERVRRFLPIEGTIQCRTEERTGASLQQPGRCDLWLDVDGAVPATVAIEVKLFAGYTTRQRERYIRELRQRGQVRRGLLVITTRPHKPPPHTLVRSEEWLGEVRWAQLDEDGLRDLPFTEPNGALAQTWRAFVDVLRGVGDLGGIATVDVNQLGSWSPQNQDAKWEAQAFLEAIADDAHDVVRAIASKHGLTARRLLGTASGSLVYARVRDWVGLSWKLSSRGSEMLELGIARGVPSNNARTLNLEMWLMPRAAQLRSGALDRPRSFDWDERWQGWVRRTPVEISVNAPASETRGVVIQEWRNGLRALNNAGALSSLGT